MQTISPSFFFHLKQSICIARAQWMEKADSKQDIALQMLLLRYLILTQQWGCAGEMACHPPQQPSPSRSPWTLQLPLLNLSSTASACLSC